MGQFGLTDFSVTHGRRGISIDRSKIPLTVDKRIAHGKVLGHSNYGVVNRRVSVGVILTDDIAHNAG